MTNYPSTKIVTVNRKRVVLQWAPGQSVPTWTADVSAQDAVNSIKRDTVKAARFFGVVK